MSIYINDDKLTSQARCPFTNRPNSIEISITDIFKKFELEQLRHFIRDSISDAVRSDKYDVFTKDKMAILKTQLYQPNSIDTLISKLKYFEQFLFNVEEYNQWMDFLKNRRK